MEKQTIGDRAFGIVNFLLLCLILVIVIYPLIFVLSASISNPELLLKGEIRLLPKEITFEGYAKVFKNNDVMRGYLNTFVYTGVGTVINLMMTTAGAYALSRKNLYGRNVITALLIFTMFFSGGMIPTYLVIKDLHMLNTIWAMVIPGAISVYNLIIMRTFFQTSIPNEIEEAAHIDGCSNLQTLFRIVLPLSTPIIAVMVLFYAVSHWNSFFDGLIYLTDRKKFPLQLILREILIQEDVADMDATMAESVVQQAMSVEGMKYALVVVANIPVLIMYPFVQKYFVKGVMIGSLKG
ncbi:carbohydrate ABC transporter permease [Lederbergia galactosidilytica]|uniref:Sugar ABC transporter permease n=1 Tax=Lederbergia galactosidilytica TaxID=217031 RepID=A0A0Q9XZ22_9BACI|nr:carbohydrate ABC transporter permease [Lederbergia galactosidilytica]KRG13828.1 sugar ABC transporter permease [Virgibacillus soli]KRG14028.1 sugar ABC transporter permease [Lederbergia galactosidilytica]MBP1914121.1 putative aldouronate transport system permease protein [Lederbergia galactosidilytica]OAK67415.1 sugar ABC transporter permease [Lederbergia galactosidilytica]